MQSDGESEQKEGKKMSYYRNQEMPDLEENKEFPGIRSHKDLYNALSDIWCLKTCAPRMQKDWSMENKTLGQCSVTDRKSTRLNSSHL